MNRLKVNYKNPEAHYEIADFLKKHIDKDIIVVCIGTDRNIGDSLGPLVGTMLKKRSSLQVYGTLDYPVHALNIHRRLDEIKTLHPNNITIGIDASLGDYDSVGEIHVRDYPVHPGKALNKSLPIVGDISLLGMVGSNEDGTFIFDSIRLNFVVNMAKIITDSILHAVSLLNQHEERRMSNAKEAFGK